MVLNKLASYIRHALAAPHRHRCCEQNIGPQAPQIDGRTPPADHTAQESVSDSLWQRILNKSSVIGTVTAAAGCASCFPALAALAAALGLGFLAQFEELFINTLIPIFSGVALTANVLSFLSHRTWYRLAAGIAGPAIVLAARYLFWTYSWRNYLFYTGLIVMLAVAVWDLLSPAHKVCRVGPKDAAYACV